MVESRGRACRRRAWLVRGRGLRIAARSRLDRRDPRRHRRARALESQSLTGASAEYEGSDVSHGQNDCNGVLAVHRLGAFLRRVRIARRPIVDRALGAWHELVAVGLLVYIPNHHFLAWLAARMD